MPPTRRRSASSRAALRSARLAGAPVAKRPKGRRYRNLIAIPRGGRAIIYYQRRVRRADGSVKTYRRSTGTEDWQLAAKVRDAFAEQEGLAWLAPRQALTSGEPPSFADAAADLLARGPRGLSACTWEDRERVLGTEGPLVAAFGSIRLDQLSKADLHRWWMDFIEGQRSLKTGLFYLDHLGALLRFAERVYPSYELSRSPLRAFRADVQKDQRTKRGRAAQENHVRPFRPEEVAHLLEVTAAGYRDPYAQGPSARNPALLQRRRTCGREVHVVTVLLLDAGLRLGEALALRWQDIDLGDRRIYVCQALARGKHLGKPKSGRERGVDLSHRLAALLREWQLASADRADRVVELDPANYRRAFRRACDCAELGHRKPKDLRDTYASLLVTAGVQLGYVSQQLGHANIAVTARHYAKWVPGDGHGYRVRYRDPIALSASELPPDLLSRIAGTSTRSAGIGGRVLQP